MKHRSIKHSLRCVLTALFVAGFGVNAARAQNASASCDRACLKTMLDQYLNAVIKHDPAGLPLVVGFRQTENAINVRPPNGVWKSVTGLGKVQRRYFDPVSGQAGYFGLVEEGSDLAIVTLRLRVENKKLSEAEWYLARPGDPGLNGPRQPGGRPANNFNSDYLTANPPPDRVVPKAQRSTREELLAITNSYFDAITSHDGSVALTHPGCGRVENGSPTPGGSFLPPLTPAAGGAPRAGAPGGAAGAAPGGPPGGTPAAGAPGAGARQGGAPPAGGAPNAPAAGAGGRQGRGGGGGDCVASLQNFNLSMVTGRRINFVDEEAQMVLATAVFIRRPGSPTPRNVFSEWFMVDEGKIRIVWAAMFYPPPELAVPNWPPYEGNWPLPAGIVPTPAAPPAGRQ